MEPYDTIRFKVRNDFASYVKNACKECELTFELHKTNNKNYQCRIYPNNLKEWYMAWGIEANAELQLARWEETA